MSIKNEIYKTVHGWLKLAASLSDRHIIKSDNNDPRPTHPYLTVKINASDTPVGADERIHETKADGTPTEHIRGIREGMISIQGFGEGCDDWLALAGASLSMAHVQRFLRDNNLVIMRSGGTANVSAMLETEHEPRCARDFDIRYELETDPVDEVAAKSATIATDLERYEDDSETLTTNIDVEVN